MQSISQFSVTSSCYQEELGTLMMFLDSYPILFCDTPLPYQIVRPRCVSQIKIESEPQALTCDFYTSNILSVLAKNIKCLPLLYIDKTQAFWYIVNIMSNTKNSINHILIKQETSSENIIPVQRKLGSSALMSPKDQGRFNYVDKRRQDSNTRGTERDGKEPYDIKQREKKFAIGEEEIRKMSSDELLDEANRILEKGGFELSGEPVVTENKLVYTTDAPVDEEDETESLEQMGATQEHESNEIITGLRRAKRDKIANQGNPETKDVADELGDYVLNGMHIVR